MAFHYGFDLTGDTLVDECKTIPPDFQRIRALLETYADLNAFSSEDEKENILSEVILGYADSPEEYAEYPDGRFLPEIVRLFLEYGFDCRATTGTPEQCA